jgi:hypothetical protein
MPTPNKKPRLILQEPDVKEQVQAMNRRTAEAIRNRNARRARQQEAAQAHQQQVLAQQEQQRAREHESARQQELARQQEIARQQHFNCQQQTYLRQRQMQSPIQQPPNLDGAAWTCETMTEEPSFVGATPPKEGNSSPLFVPMTPVDDSPTQNAPIAPMQPSPGVVNRRLETPREDPHPPSKAQTYIQTPPTTQSRTLEAQISESRKRKRDPTQPHPDIPSIIKTLERVDQQHKLDLADRDSQILRLKLQLNDLKNADLTHESNEASGTGATMAQQSASLRAELASLKKEKIEADWKIKELCDQLQTRDDEATAVEDWSHEKISLTQKVSNMEDQLTSAQNQVHRFMEAFNREAALRTEIKTKLDAQEKFNAKLSKDLRKKSEELKGELNGGTKEKYARLAGAIRGLFEHTQMDVMSGVAFGDVGKALKRIKELVMNEEDQTNGNGNGK